MKKQNKSKIVRPTSKLKIDNVEISFLTILMSYRDKINNDEILPLLVKEKPDCSQEFKDIANLLLRRPELVVHKRKLNEYEIIVDHYNEWRKNLDKRDKSVTMSA